MKKISLFLLLSLGFTAIYAQNTVALKNDVHPPVKISRNIYGHFAEHLGRGIYGGFYVGDTSHIKNIDGIREDVVTALRALKIPNLRWPGGCFADTYHWKDGIGDRKKRPSIVNTNWGDVTEDNSFGTHDFLNLCKLLNCEPYLSGNVGSGTVQELADWVQYVNFDSKSPMSDLRRANGRQNPWNVKFWGIGNEAWGCGGNMSPEHYADVFKQYATFMANTKAAQVFKIASGANSGDYNWTNVLMKNIPLNMIDGIALHHYAVIEWAHKGSATAYSDKQYLQSMASALEMEELVTKHSAILDRYDPQKKVALVVDEWGGWYDVETATNPGFLYQQNTMRDALIAGTTLNTFNNHADRVRMANLAQCINVLQSVILTDKEKMILTPTYYVMQMYAVHQDATLIPLDVKSDLVAGTKLPAISASASRDSSGVTHISITNLDPSQSKQISINLGVKFKKSSAKILNSGKLRDYNSFTQPDLIRPKPFTGFKFEQQVLIVNMPPHAVSVIELQ